MRTMLGVAAVVLVSVVSVAAHMALSKSSPEADAVLDASPRLIQAWFTEEPDPAVSRLTLERAGTEIELGGLMIHDDKSLMATVPSTLADGDYTVNWRSAGDDGHAVRGEFTFTVRANR